MHTLVIVFLAIFALTALLQAGAAVAAAIVARKLGQRFDEIENRFEREVRPALGRLAQAVSAAAELSQQAVGHAERIDEAVTGAADRVDHVVDRVTRGVQDRVVGSIEQVEGQVGRRVRKATRPFAQAAALVQGIRRGMKVWRTGSSRRPVDAAEPPHVA
jgi:methyl-accepting chemotaxis protein